MKDENAIFYIEKFEFSRRTSVYCFDGTEKRKKNVFIIYQFFCRKCCPEPTYQVRTRFSIHGPTSGNELLNI